MGAVWRADDTTLGRQVAVKVLPPEFSADPDRLSRFEREAKLLASLNHPLGVHRLAWIARSRNRWTCPDVGEWSKMAKPTNVLDT